jgi:putative ABC transport system substrate-binding protein
MTLSQEKEEIMIRQTVKWSVVAVVLATISIASAQRPGKVPRIGYLGNAAATSASDLKVFEERLHDLGFIERQNVTIERRYFAGKVERLPELIADLIRLNCDVIIAVGNEAAGVAKSATKVIPIVMTSTNDAAGADWLRWLAPG